MQPCRVLLLDHREDTRENTAFLLRLAGFQVSAVQEAAEAVNWAASRRESPEPFGVLIVSNLESRGTALELLQEMFRRGVPLPVLFILRAAGRESFSCPAASALPVACCRPDELIEMLRKLLRENP
ncbi:hypothetical protein DESUT3_34460 [Desulfuromonas versatilis]|uniref:Response regulatory domain-containing protein n=1 Tax=Desulfuromonas versatilis TaxID=2802975 RepID=A0ABN6E273_9BACT|nr:hypothetical protein [Desulfuromonas versatilis]BCR06377.1 hypothetical protein DESUT3_34460 [Desulfuromonas versatilis]